MKANRLASSLLVLLVSWLAVQISAQPGEADRKLFAEIKTYAEKGDAKAQYTLGCCYGKGFGVTKDSSEAVKWYRKAAEQGDAEAQYNLGSAYQKGEGVTKDSEEAIKWCRKAAEQEFALAEYVMGMCYWRGDEVKKDTAEALKW